MKTFHDYPIEGDNYEPPARRCPLCSHSMDGYRHDWSKDRSKWTDTYSCPRCTDIEKHHPAVFEWVCDVIFNLKTEIDNLKKKEE